MDSEGQRGIGATTDGGRDEARDLAALTDVLLAFVEGIGIEVRRRAIEEATVLPGLTIADGALVVDLDRLRHPGDVLHEAGHLAVMSPSERAVATAPLVVDGGFEMAAIAWSWAASEHLQLDPTIVFHEHGYRGGGDSLVENFSARRFFGVPILAWVGLTTNDSFPSMAQWVRTSEPPAL